MSADIPKEFLRNRAFDLFSWFELNAKEVRDEEPRSPSVLGSEPEMVSSDPDFEYLTDCTDPDMPPLMDADSDSDSEDGYSTDDTEEEYLSDGDRVCIRTRLKLSLLNGSGAGGPEPRDT
ncbi:hypothetical protein DFH09DRAFT_1068622 [Mycena vulgaris]|nr:hypothetical protein DFH09DRAFT_1068622 [Mycena vulgaris]